jgi:hypothetical protein
MQHNPSFYDTEVHTLGHTDPSVLDRYFFWLSITNNPQASSILVLTERLESSFGSHVLAQSIADGVAAVVDIEDDKM